MLQSISATIASTVSIGFKARNHKLILGAGYLDLTTHLSTKQIQVKQGAIAINLYLLSSHKLHNGGAKSINDLGLVGSSLNGYTFKLG